MIAKYHSPHGSVKMFSFQLAIGVRVLRALPQRLRSLIAFNAVQM
jgi:hypothetical protein